MSLSANTLFHFTKDRETLISILKNEFYPRYSLENWEPVLGVEREVAVPMVCFCDIPLSQIHNHTEVYGSYAIGLKKDWGKKHGINPIIYTYKNALSSKYINTLLSKAKEDGSDIDDYIRLLSFTKPYEGNLWRISKYQEKTINFYDEREWRYIPNIEKDQNGIALTVIGKKDFLDKKKIQFVNKKLESKPLSFNPKDIKYIIVKKEAEILDMVNAIWKIKSPKYSPDDVAVLQTRIISMEHIRDDF